MQTKINHSNKILETLSETPVKGYPFQALKTPESKVEHKLRIAPFLKWAGGKRQLLPELLKRVPSLTKARYHEPFIGGGALFFALSEHLRLGKKKARLADLNLDLILTYQAVRDNITDLIDLLREHENTEEHFYKVRSQNVALLSPLERAARMIYLNKTCFNGLFRENRKGQFNVPFGHYNNPSVCDTDRLYAAHVVLQGVTIEHAGFDSILAEAKTGDFVYFDPPYLPISPTASFVGYQGQGFGHEAHLRLAEVGQQLAEQGINVMISNSSCPLIDVFYQGFNKEEIDAPRSISSTVKGRGKVKEVLLTAGPAFEQIVQQSSMPRDEWVFEKAVEEGAVALPVM